jgi:glutathione synthase
MIHVFLIDPPESLHTGKDTSFALMLEAQRQGHGVHVMLRGDISREPSGLVFKTRKAVLHDRQENAFELSAWQQTAASDFDVVWIRTDPPFDVHYLTDTWLLSQTGNRPLVLNAPHGLRTINEKIWAAQFTEITPPTLITANAADYQKFLQTHGAVVVKPTDGFGGSSVFIVKSGDKNAAVVFETLVRMSGYVIVQKYLPAATEGDKRILVLEGEILGAVLRLHGEHDHRNNFAAGGSANAAAITADDETIVATLRPHLKTLGIFFAGIDVIGGKLIEVNVTSPTCLREMQKFTTENLAKKIIDAAARAALGA